MKVVMSSNLKSFSSCFSFCLSCTDIPFPSPDLLLPRRGRNGTRIRPFACKNVNENQNVHRCLYGLIFILYLKDKQSLAYDFSFTKKQWWRESTHIYLSLVRPVNMTGKNLAYFPTPNCFPNSCILFESRRIRASHN